MGIWEFNANFNDSSKNQNHAINNGASFTQDKNGNQNSAINLSSNNSPYITLNNTGDFNLRFHDTSIS